MEISLPADLQTDLMRLANQQGRDPEALAREAIERFVRYDDWFIRQVEAGLSQIDRGEVLAHEDVGARLEKRLNEKRPRI